MPTYQYACEKCGLEFDQYQPITAEALTVCSKAQCRQSRWGKGKLKRLIGAGAGLLFKGSGFYITDYRSEGYKTAAKNDIASSHPPKEAKSTGAADTKATPAKPAAPSTPKKSKE